MRAIIRRIEVEQATYSFDARPYEMKKLRASMFGEPEPRKDEVSSVAFYTYCAPSDLAPRGGGPH